MVEEISKRGWIARCWHYLWSPSRRWPLLVLIIGGLAFGVLGSGVFAYAMHYSSTNEFCSSCHAQDVVPEWKQSVHYVNRTGFTAGCVDCHEPRDPLGNLARKMAAVNEVYHHLVGTISTPEKFKAHRRELAETEWARLRADNSQECRNCHAVDQMTNAARPYLPPMHKAALDSGRNCIDCHQGVAHQQP